MSRRTRVKLLLCGVVCVLVTAGTVWLMWPRPKPRIGMSRAEVQAIWGSPNKKASFRDASGFIAKPSGALADSMDVYPCESRLMAQDSCLCVYYLDDKVVACEVEEWHDKPPLLWFDQIKKAIGW
jgi:hypothetical protein